MDSSSGVVIDDPLRCEEALRAASNDGRVCPLDMDHSAACSATGTRAPGEACWTSVECAPQPAGTVVCESGACANLLDGTLGDSPCVGDKIATGSGPGYYFESASVPPTGGYLCDEAAEVRCDFETHACTARANIGEACSSSFACVHEAWCHMSALICEKKSGLGDSCWGPDCDHTMYCSDAKVCAPFLADGDPCQTPLQCATGACTDGVCGRDGDARALFRHVFCE